MAKKSARSRLGASRGVAELKRALSESRKREAATAIENARLLKELQARDAAVTEALEQQTATADILRIISGSPTDIQPVLDAVASTAARLCDASDAVILRIDGDVLRWVAHYGSFQSPAAGEALPVNRGSTAGRAVVDRRSIHVHDLAAADKAEFPVGRALAERFGYRSVVSTPLLRQGQPVGAITIRRLEVRPFSDQQIKLLEIFADQAVIAIENVRLFKELQARNAEVTEALEQQTATADILKVISSSPTNLQPVFDAILENATRLCDAHMANLLLHDGDKLLPVAQRGGSAEYAQWVMNRGRYQPVAGGAMARMLAEGRPVQVSDLMDSSGYRDRTPGAVALVKLGGARTSVLVPLLKEGRVVGGITIYRPETRPFSQKQIDLVSTFANQAVIAIENVRLFKELQARNAEVIEALEQQTATAEILKVISSSPTDVQPVFDAIVRSAVGLCDGLFSALHRFDGELIHEGAQHNYTPEALEEVRRIFPTRPTRALGSGRAILERAVVHIPDVEADPEYLNQALTRAIGMRSVLCVPMLREGAPIGVIVVGRAEPGPFSDNEIALLRTFADQAVIAIENVRLFNETKEALEQQTVTADILRVISSSPTDVQPVFDAIVRSAAPLFGDLPVSLLLVDGDHAQRVATTRLPDPQADRPLPLRDDSFVTSRAILRREVVHVPDLLAEDWIGAAAKERAKRRGDGAALCAPMLRADGAVGAIVVNRATPGHFTDKQIALLKTFADQAMIAVENVRLFNELQARNAEVTESLEQQTAMAEILRVISSSPTDIQPVLNAVAESAARLCDAGDVIVRRVDGDVYRLVAHVGSMPVTPSPELAVSRRTFMGRAIRERRTIHIHDVLEPHVREEYPESLLFTRQEPGYRTVLCAPLLREDTAIGVIIIRRPDVRPFTDKQIALLQTFADQAVIAIENVRLFKELQARNAEVTEALERQTATTEILRVISSSPTDLQPVMDAVVRSAARLCGASEAQILRPDGDVLRLVAEVGSAAMPPARPINRGYAAGRAFVEGRTLHIPDILELTSDYPETSAPAFGTRTLLATPLMREGVAIGVIRISRREVLPFTEQQIALLRTFADQAVIAIENVRLFKELQARNAEVTEALEQQTVTANILKVISSSPTDTQPVFDAILENATRLCDAHMGHLRLYDGENVQTVAQRGVSAEFARFLIERGPFRPAPSGVYARMNAERRPIQIADRRDSPNYRDGHPGTVALVELGGARATILVPMLKEERVVGDISIYRPEVRPFTQKQIDLVSTFASQAVIAIENVRLFKELQARNAEVTEALEQQTATADILKVISSSPTDTQPVFDAIVKSGFHLFSGSTVSLRLAKGQHTEIVAGTLPIHDTSGGAFPIPLDDESIPSVRAMRRREFVHVPDMFASDAWVGEAARRRAEQLDFRAIMCAPMVRDNLAIGSIQVFRSTAGLYTDKQVALLKTFADQAVIAIENVRLFREIQDKSRQLEVANKHKSEFLAHMSHELRTPLNAVIGFSEALLARMFGEVNAKQDEYLKDIHSSGQHLLSLINDILDLSKVEAGRMELELSEFQLPAALQNAMTLVRERAQNHDIGLALRVDEKLGAIRADERKVKQIVLNLLSNAVKFTPDGGRVEVDARMIDSSVEISVKDTGPGIAHEDQASLFEEFRQLGRGHASKYEGTGLGLALTRRFVELHGGKIGVESAPGQGSTFTFTLPLTSSDR
jgi:GAF domain-containing protein